MTSPSGRHLGIYKSLAKHVCKKKKDTTNDTNEDKAEGLLKQGQGILYLVFDMMALALCHLYLLKHWHVVWTVFIKKRAW